MLAALARSLEACNPEPGPNPNADPNPETNQVVGAMCPFARELEFKLEVFGENSCSRAVTMPLSSLRVCWCMCGCLCAGDAEG